MKELLVLGLESWVLNLDLLVISADQMSSLCYKYFSVNKFIQHPWIKLAYSRSVNGSLFPFLWVWSLFLFTSIHYYITTFKTDLITIILFAYVNASKYCELLRPRDHGLSYFHILTTGTQETYTLIDLNKNTFINCQILFLSTWQPFPFLPSQRNPAFVWIPMCLTPESKPIILLSLAVVAVRVGLRHSSPVKYKGESPGKELLGEIKGQSEAKRTPLNPALLLVNWDVT